MSIKLINPFSYFKKSSKKSVPEDPAAIFYIAIEFIDAKLKDLIERDERAKELFYKFSIKKMSDGVMLKYRSNDGSEYYLQTSDYDKVSLVQLNSNYYGNINPDMIWYYCDEENTEEYNIKRLKMILYLLLSSAKFGDIYHEKLFGDYGMFNEYDIPMQQTVKDSHILKFDITSDEIINLNNLYETINIWKLYTGTHLLNIYGPSQFEEYDINRIREIVDAYEKFSAKKLFKDKLASGCQECKSAAQLFYSLVGAYVFSKFTTSDLKKVGAIKLVNFQTEGFAEIVNEIQDYIKDRTGHDILVHPKSIDKRFISKTIEDYF